MRRRRWKLMLRHVPRLAELRGVDLGGTALWWPLAPVRPRHVTVVNFHEAEAGEDSPDITTIEGDALRADELLRGERFDLVFSNSLIEHLGGHSARSRLAEVVVSLGPAYVVQTPYRYSRLSLIGCFRASSSSPCQPGLISLRDGPLGHTYGWEPDAAAGEVMSTEVVSASEMRRYFPHAEIVWERIMGVPKSMIAIKHVA